MGWTTVSGSPSAIRLLLAADVGGIIGNLDIGVPAAASTLTTPFAAQPVDPADRVHRLPDDVRDHHAGADHRRLRQPGHVQGLHGLPDRLAAVRLLPVRPHGLGRRLSQKWGVLDFAGGIVVHNIAGMAALASVLYVGRRRCADSGPHSIPLVALGTGLLWFGWYGFNAGSEFKVDSRHAARVPEHRHRRVVRRDHLAGRGVDLREEAEVRRAADRRGRRVWRRSRRRPATCRQSTAVAHRHRRRRRLLRRGRAQEQARLGRRARRLGRARRRRLARDRPARRVRHHGRQPGRRRRPAPRQPGSSSGSRWPRGRLLALCVRLHVRDARRHRPDHAGADRRGGRARARRAHARGERVRARTRDVAALRRNTLTA